MNSFTVNKEVICYHCGDICASKAIVKDDKFFCCNGCKTVYELLTENQLYTYYDLENSPGVSAGIPQFKDKFSYLDDQAVTSQLMEFNEGEISKVTFFIPSIHCSSCIWLLEKLYRLSPAITNSRVNFVKKQVTIIFNNKDISLRQVAELITSVGYEPEINLKSLDEKVQASDNRKLYLKIAIAGFAFGNSMLFSLPDYLDSDQSLTLNLVTLFAILNIILAVPVLFYSASDYFISSFKGLKKKILNIDVPISLGILALVSRSLYEIFTASGTGYFDSFNGLVFFLLVGRLFQEKTYATLSFERDYKSYFPVSVTILDNNREKIIPISKLDAGDIAILRNQELIPADAILLSDEASIDYSFVSGESEPVPKSKDDNLFAGGRLIGNSVKIKIVKQVSQSYLTKLWNNDVFEKESNNELSHLSDTVAKYFTIAVLFTALFAGLYWMNINGHAAVNAISAVLIVACPCALALSIPFTFGNAMRIYSRNKFYIKNIHTIERFKSISYIIFDKTGTLTWQKKPEIDFTASLSDYNKLLIKSLVHNSVHPLSRYIYNFLPGSTLLPVRDFVEISGKGIMGEVDGHKILMGSSEWIGESAISEFDEQASCVHVSTDGEYKGTFIIKSQYRKGLNSVLKSLAHLYKIAIISGDNARGKSYFKNLFKKHKIEGEIYFNQSPFDKLNFLLRHQNAGERTLMVGDGLNDAGALKQSDLGISISEDINTFSPACDAILEASNFRMLPVFFKYARINYFIVIASFVLSFAYNSIGIYFAVSGGLSPLIAAILMPLSSITVVAFATFSTRIFAKKLGL
jgi:P-type Cu+ transporter